MHTVRRTIGAALLGAALFVVAGVGVFHRLEDRAATATAAVDPRALTAPIAPAASLEPTIADLQAHLNAQPDDAHALALLGLAYAQEATRTADPSYYPKAEDALRRSLDLQPDGNVEALVGMGVVANARHDFAEGVRWGREAADANPDAAHILGVIGDGQLELGHYRAAFATFDRMATMRPDVASYARVSYARELRGDLPGAFAAMRMALAAAGTPDDAAWVSFQLGDLSFRAGRLGPATFAYRRAAALAPTFVPAQAGLAKIAWARGNVERSIRLYRDVVDRYPLPEHVIALGDLYTLAGRTRAAADTYDLAGAEATLFRANGVNVDVELALFEADHDDARTALDDARAGWAVRHSVHAADALAWALHATGNDRAAARYERLALRLGTRDASYRFHAGMIALALGRTNEARANLGAALAINPNFSILGAPQAERTLARLGGAPATTSSSRP